MRILTVRQPWAWAIIHGGKTVENRTRNIAGTYRGPIAIHAGKAFDYDAFGDTGPMGDLLAGALSAGEEIIFEPGAIIGIVDLTEVHHSTRQETQHPTCWAPDENLMDRGIGYCSPWAQSGAIHLVLANPRPLAKPIPYKGMLGLRELPAGVADHVLAEAGPVIELTPRPGVRAHDRALTAYGRNPMTTRHEETAHA
ncbi:hypothetical protein [Leifsonia shinshuensis]